MTNPDGTEIKIFKPDTTQTAVQGIPQFFGVSENSVGAKNLSLNVTVFGPSGRAKTHYHKDYETAIYTVSGRAALFWGDKLEHEGVLEPGCFCFIPGDVPHVAFNLSSSENVMAITARNDAREQENVVLTPELDTPELDARIAEWQARA
ncbi:cupin domain-containing protein [Shimia sediminis]|uniref:cupin domain-containing protein n=1 Tax=Shimia sediminis TaxID=2497945 RepID=UPI000F8D8C36|nr:cupin domain-containing protein [Shimia sediminis]